MLSKAILLQRHLFEQDEPTDRVVFEEKKSAIQMCGNLARQPCVKMHRMTAAAQNTNANTSHCILSRA